jgi:hypothetical protein
MNGNVMRLPLTNVKMEEVKNKIPSSNGREEIGQEKRTKKEVYSFSLWNLSL